MVYEIYVLKLTNGTALSFIVQKIHTKIISTYLSTTHIIHSCMFSYTLHRIQKEIGN